MKAQWDLVDEAAIPHDDATMYLRRRGNAWGIWVDDRQLMTNRLHGSEDALADLACDRLSELETARILVGGLGMGFTLAAALRRVGADGNVTVAELVPAVEGWNREHCGKASGHPLRDSRTQVYAGDVGDLVENPGEPWSAILLDVDNGPEALTRPTNGWLYTDEGVQHAWSALIPGGVLAIWSAYPQSAGFTRRLQATGFVVEVVDHVEPYRSTLHGSDTIWLAAKHGGDPGSHGADPGSDPAAEGQTRPLRVRPGR